MQILIVRLLSSVPVFVADTQKNFKTFLSKYRYIIDAADVLTDEEEQALNDKLTQIHNSEKLDLIKGSAPLNSFLRF